MPYNQNGSCWHCGHRLGPNDYARESVCPECGRATHVCRNCRYYDTHRPNACAETVADPVANKERPNFCGYFEAIEQRATGAALDEALRQTAEDLFKL